MEWHLHSIVIFGIIFVLDVYWTTQSFLTICTGTINGYIIYLVHCTLYVLLRINVPKYKNVTLLLYIIMYMWNVTYLTIKTLDCMYMYLKRKNSEIVFELVCHKPNGSRLPNLGIYYNAQALWLTVDKFWPGLFLAVWFGTVMEWSWCKLDWLIKVDFLACHGLILLLNTRIFDIVE